MKVIVCGSAPRLREGPDRPGWTDRELLRMKLSELDRDSGPLVVIEGEAAGADLMAREWAEDHDREVRPFPSNWSRGRAAGPIRNRRMLDEVPDRVVAFSVAWPPVGGTLDMTLEAARRQVRVDVITPDGRVRRNVRPPELTA